MLENPLDVIMYLGVVKTIILVCLIIFVFEYFYSRVSLLNPGTQLGMGVFGFIGFIGFGLGLCSVTTGIAVFLLGSFIFSGRYRLQEGSRDQREMLSRQKAIGY